MASPIEDASAMHAKSQEFHLLFYNFFPGFQSEKTRKSGFWAHVWIISWNLCENKDFCPKPWKFRPKFHQEKVWKSNLLYGGRAKVFWNSPLHAWYPDVYQLGNYSQLWPWKFVYTLLVVSNYHNNFFIHNSQQSFGTGKNVNATYSHWVIILNVTLVSQKGKRITIAWFEI